MDNESKLKIERVFCNQCGSKTKHQHLFSHRTAGSERVDDLGNTIDWSTTYDLFECGGCEHVTLREVFDFSEWDKSQTVFFPPPVSRRVPRWVGDLSSDLEALFDEVYKALHADSSRIAMMGARAVVDMVMLEKVGDVGTFAQKLDALQQHGFLSTKNKELLDAALDVGNAAAHRGHKPDADQVKCVMDIVENLVQATLLLESTQDLRKGVPQRKKKTKP